MIYAIQKRWGELGKQRIIRISEEFSIGWSTANKYIHMTERDISKLDTPTYYKKRKTVMDEYLNIIYKMLRDKIKPEIIIAYVVKSGYNGNLQTLETYIRLVAKNNFGIRLYQNWAHDFSYPDDVTIIRRTELFRYMTTKNPKTKKSAVVAQNFEIIKQRYAVIAILQEAYDEFYDILMGNVPDKLDDFINKYKKTVIQGFIVGIPNDIIPVKNAISYDESNGFVEGNNNKFKLIKRILYGRANLDTLFKKCYFAFKINSKSFQLSNLM